MDVSRRAVLRGATFGTAAAATGAAHTAGASPLADPATNLTTKAVYGGPLRPEVLVVGAGAGGIAAALALLRTGHTVVLTEPTDWVGGQLTSQAVPADDHAWVDEGLGCTTLYQEAREEVRRQFRRFYPLMDKSFGLTRLNPGHGWAHLSAEPALWHSVLQSMLAPYEASERLRLLLRARPIAAASAPESTSNGSRAVAVRSVDFELPDGRVTVRPKLVIEASELGDLLPLADVPYVVGREPGGERASGGTGEPHNRTSDADPECQQAFTVVAALAFAAGRDGSPVTVGSYRDFSGIYTRFGTNQRDVFDPSKDWSWSEGVNFWQYRRVRWTGHLRDDDLGDISLLNQKENDHQQLRLIPARGATDPVRQAAAISRATDQTLGLVRYFQTAYRRPEGDGTGWPGLFLVPSAMGTSSGLAQFPYVREARRIKAERIVTELDVGVQARQQQGTERAVQFPDSVGTSAGPIDIHPNNAFPHGLFQPAYPFQIPLRSLFPRGTANLLAGGKTLGVTQIANGAYRYHPTEWGVGEAAGYAAAFALGRKLRLRELLDEPTGTELLRYLDEHGIRRNWPAELHGTEVGSLGQSGRS